VEIRRYLPPAMVLLCGSLQLAADDPPAPQPPAATQGQSAPPAAVETARGPDQPVPLNPQGTVLIDRKHKRLLLKTRVVLREGVLEMFLCKSQTKEHESILSIDSEAYIIHAGLQVLGAEPGTPVRFDEEFHPPTGPHIDVWVNWTDAEGKEHREKAQSWVRNVTRRYYEHAVSELPAGVKLDPDGELRYDARNKILIWFGPMSEKQRNELLAMSGKADYREAIEAFFKDSQSRALEAEWIFGGSGFYTQKDGTKWYQAEAGNLICVSNFSDAMIDISVESSASNDARLFEPYTERIPPLGTPVTVELIPVHPESKPAAAEGK
jgi:hypothetical protein